MSNYLVRLQLDAGGPEPVAIPGTEREHTSSARELFSRALAQSHLAGVADLHGLPAGDAAALLAAAVQELLAAPALFADLVAEPADLAAARDFLYAFAADCGRFPGARVEVEVR